MSIILTGMNMPENCEKCGISYEDHYFTYDIPLKCPRLYSPLGIERKEIHKDCPLKSVDGLIEKIEKYGGNEEKSVYKNLHPSYTRGLKDAIKIIKEYCGMDE